MNTQDFANSIILRQSFLHIVQLSNQREWSTSSSTFRSDWTAKFKTFEKWPTILISLEGGQQPPKGFWDLPNHPKNS
jgi:hypothetical protein